jgi:hypothetical protein
MFNPKAVTPNMKFTHLQLRAVLAIWVWFTGMAMSAAAHAQSGEAAQQYEIEFIIFSYNKPSGSTEDWKFEETLAGEVSAGVSSPAPSIAFQTFPPLEPSQLRMGKALESVNRSAAYTIVAHFGWKQPGKSADTAIPVSISSLLGEGTPISGTVTLVRSRFVHLKLNLVYQASDGQRYVLREQRRIQKTGEKHYLDHPHFGAIVLVTPSS